MGNNLVAFKILGGHLARVHMIPLFLHEMNGKLIRFHGLKICLTLKNDDFNAKFHIDSQSSAPVKVIKNGRQGGPGSAEEETTTS